MIENGGTPQGQASTSLERDLTKSTATFWAKPYNQLATRITAVTQQPFGKLNPESETFDELDMAARQMNSFASSGRS